MSIEIGCTYICIWTRFEWYIRLRKRYTKSELHISTYQILIVLSEMEDKIFHSSHTEIDLYECSRKSIFIVSSTKFYMKTGRIDTICMGDYILSIPEYFSLLRFIETSTSERSIFEKRMYRRRIFYKSVPYYLPVSHQNIEIKIRSFKIWLCRNRSFIIFFERFVEIFLSSYDLYERFTDALNSFEDKRKIRGFYRINMKRWK